MGINVDLARCRSIGGMTWMRKASRQDADAAEGELEGSKCLSRIGPPVSKRRSDNAPICHHSLQFVNETGGGHFIFHGTAQASGRIPVTRFLK